jgi:hypothetical protein
VPKGYRPAEPVLDYSVIDHSANTATIAAPSIDAVPPAEAEPVEPLLEIPDADSDDPGDKIDDAVVDKIVSAARGSAAPDDSDPDEAVPLAQTSWCSLPGRSAITAWLDANCGADGWA